VAILERKKRPERRLFELCWLSAYLVAGTRNHRYRHSLMVAI
jgi:hypothetical protein